MRRRLGRSSSSLDMTEEGTESTWFSSGMMVEAQPPRCRAHDSAIACSSDSSWVFRQPSHPTSGWLDRASTTPLRMSLHTNITLVIDQSLKVTENDTIQSGTHHFLLVLHSHHRPILHRFWDKRRFKSKIANFPTPCILCSYEGFPL